MNKLYEILSKDIMEDNFTTKEYLIYGIIVPMIFIVTCVIAEVINNL